MISPALNLIDAQGTQLASLAARLQNRDTLPPLVPKETWNEGLQAILEDLDPAEIVGQDDVDSGSAVSVKSGLLIWNDSMDPAHELLQDATDATGSYWHGIIHRREPDFSNAKYWFRRVGDHPIFPALREQALGVFRSVADTSEYARLRLASLEKGDHWDSIAFVDWCEQAVKKSNDYPDETDLLEAVQLREIELLVTHSYRQAVRSGR